MNCPLHVGTDELNVKATFPLLHVSNMLTFPVYSAAYAVLPHIINVSPSGVLNLFMQLALITHRKLTLDACLTKTLID